jgi:hypothetical protein
MTDPDWVCPKPGCGLDVDGHSFGLAIAHCLDMDEREADDAAEHILTRAERDLLDAPAQPASADTKRDGVASDDT